MHHKVQTNYWGWDAFDYKDTFIKKKKMCTTNSFINQHYNIPLKKKKKRFHGEFIKKTQAQQIWT